MFDFVDAITIMKLTLCFPKDLMLPGVVVSSSGLPHVKQGDFCTVTVVNNRQVHL